jgi:5-oxoprolinase (ATP-hydrolysing)
MQAGVVPQVGPVQADPGPVPTPSESTSAYFEVGGRQDTPAWLLSSLCPGHQIAGPALLIDTISTIVVEPGCTAEITAAGDVRIDVGGTSGAGVPSSLTECDPIQLAIFSHRWPPRSNLCLCISTLSVGFWGCHG